MVIHTMQTNHFRLNFNKTNKEFLKTNLYNVIWYAV